MHELISALVGSLVTGILGIWLLPIWRDARRYGPADKDKLPKFYNPGSLSHALLLGFQWMNWGQIGLGKEFFAHLESRLAQGDTLGPQMIMSVRGGIFFFPPFQTQYLS